jgi:hypothetical protein
VERGRVGRVRGDGPFGLGERLREAPGVLEDDREAPPGAIAIAFLSCASASGYRPCRCSAPARLLSATMSPGASASARRNSAAASSSFPEFSRSMPRMSCAT